jgi:hypothetical protein
MTPCLLAAPTSNYLAVASSQVERRCIRQSLGEYSNYYLLRRMFDSRLRATAKIRLTLLLLFPIFIVEQIYFVA